MVSISEVTMFVLSVAVACLHVLKPVLDCLDEISPRSLPVAAVVLLTLTTVYLMGNVLVYLSVTPALASLVSPANLRGFAGLARAVACSLLLLLAVPLVPFLSRNM